MKLTEIVSDYPVKDNDNLRHIDKAISPPERTIRRQNVKTEAKTDAQPTKSTSNDRKQGASPLGRVEKRYTSTERHIWGV